MHCNGQCQLSKKVDAENNKDQTNPERKSDSKMEVLSAKNFFSNIQFLVHHYHRRNTNRLIRATRLNTPQIFFILPVPNHTANDFACSGMVSTTEVTMRL